VRSLLQLFEEHPFAVLGAVLGVLWGLLALRLGFLAALFILLMSGFGIWVGRQFEGEDGRDLQDLFERFMNRQERD